MIYLSNAFSLGMVAQGVDVQIQEVSVRPNCTSWCKSIVGHADTARLLGVAFNRESVKLVAGDILVVAQYDGTRLPEGATELPEGAGFRWFEVAIR